MIKIELSKDDTFCLGCALLVAFTGAGILAAALAYYVIANLDKIPEGEKPYFTFTTETKE